MKRKLVALMMAVLATSMVITPDIAYADVISDATATKKEAEDNLSELDTKVNELKKKQEKLQQEIDEMDAELVQLLYDIDILEEEVDEKRTEIKATQKDLDAAKKVEQEQLDAMKLRIKYMYENNGNSVSTSIIEGKSTASELNKSTLFNEMYNYDRDQLDEYEKAKQKVEDIMNKLTEEKDELEEKENSLLEEKKSLEDKMKEKKITSDNYSKELEDAKKLAQQYRETINEQNKILSKQISMLYPTGNTGAYDKSYVAPGNGIGTDVANYALQFLGNPYVYGGTSLTNGIDCSAFTQAVYAHFGYSLPRTSASQRNVGRAVSANELQPGDLVCYSGHVAIYIGNGKIVHASNKKSGIKISNNMGYRNIITFRRIVG